MRPLKNTIGVTAGLEEHNQNEGKNYFRGRIDSAPAASAAGSADDRNSNYLGITAGNCRV